MTEGKVAQEIFAAGFKFMRDLREPEFRAFLKQHGWHPGEHVIMTSEHEPVIDVMARTILHETGGRALVAIADDQQRFGFRLLTIEVTPRRRRKLLQRRVETINIAPDATMGMLYAAFSRCGEYVPSEWSAPVTIRKEPEPV